MELDEVHIYYETAYTGFQKRTIRSHVPTVMFEFSEITRWYPRKQHYQGLMQPTLYWVGRGWAWERGVCSQAVNPSSSWGPFNCAAQEALWPQCSSAWGTCFRAHSKEEVPLLAKRRLVPSMEKNLDPQSECIYLPKRTRDPHRSLCPAVHSSFSIH